MFNSLTREWSIHAEKSMDRFTKTDVGATFDLTEKFSLVWDWVMVF